MMSSAIATTVDERPARMMPYFEYVFFVLVTMASISMAIQEHGQLKTQPTTADKDTAEKNEGNETSIEKYFTSSEKDGLVQTINDLRRTVGAADMTYLDWSTQMENDASKFTAKCNYDTWVVTNGWGMRQYSTAAIDPVASLKDIFDDSQFYYGMRSVYLLGIGVSIRFCSSAQVNGVYRSNIYIGGYLFSHTSGFTDNTMQYLIGPACTKCRSYKFWCDGGLCRDDCTSQMSTCSCFTECANCTDWSNTTCTCPGRPYTDAVALQCNYYSRGETMHMARDLWTTIVLSSLALLFYLQ